MDLRCSVLGHDFADGDRTHHREKREDEAVVTVRTYRACQRCGTRELVSENTRIQTMADGGETHEDAEDEDVEILQGELPDPDDQSETPDDELDDDIIEAPSEEPTGDVPSDIDLTDVDDGTMDPDDADPSSIIEGSDAPDDEGPATESTTDPAEDGRGSFACPACGYTERAGATSLRAGDICPSCRDDYLERRDA